MGACYNIGALFYCLMDVKILVNNLGQHIIAGVKAIQDSETEVLLAYWLKHARLIRYSLNEENKPVMNFASFCPAAVDAEFALNAEFVAARLDPRQDVVETYLNTIAPEPDELSIDPSENG